MILRYDNGRLTEKKSYREALGLEDKVSPVVSLVGAGGKTTTALHLTGEYKKVGIPVIVTTSTHLEIWEQPWFLLKESMEELQQTLKKYGQVWVGIPSEKQKKMKPVSPAFLEELCKMEVPVIVEADGARKMPCKVPAEHEPVIVPQTTIVCSIYGLDAIGERICDCCFRSELAAKMLDKQETDRLEAGDLAKIAADKAGGRKNIRNETKHWVILNKADTRQKKSLAEEVCRELKRYGIRQILVTSFEEEAKAEKFR